MITGSAPSAKVLASGLLSLAPNRYSVPVSAYDNSAATPLASAWIPAAPHGVAGKSVAMATCSAKAGPTTLRRMRVLPDDRRKAIARIATMPMRLIATGGMRGFRGWNSRVFRLLRGRGQTPAQNPPRARLGEDCTALTSQQGTSRIVIAHDRRRARAPHPEAAVRLCPALRRDDLHRRRARLQAGRARAARGRGGDLRVPDAGRVVEHGGAALRAGDGQQHGPLGL